MRSVEYSMEELMGFMFVEERSNFYACYMNDVIRINSIIIPVIICYDY